MDKPQLNALQKDFDRSVYTLKYVSLYFQLDCKLVYLILFIFQYIHKEYLSHFKNNPSNLGIFVF